MRSGKRMAMLAGLLALVSLTVLGFRVGGRLYHNWQQAQDFSYQSPIDQYRLGVPIEEMDLSRFGSALTITQTAVGMPVDNNMELPVGVQYFTVKDGKKTPKLELAKGTRVLWIPTPELNDICFGYGLLGYPTHERGWRYVRPFLPSEQPGDVDQLPYYFVRTVELEAVAEQAFRTIQRLVQAAQSRGLSPEEAAFANTRRIDRIFYERGIFCSPDLREPVWSLVDTVLLCLCVGLALPAWLFRRAGRRAKFADTAR